MLAVCVYKSVCSMPCLDVYNERVAVVGCADVWPLPAKSWVRYAADRSTAHVGCEHSGNVDAVWKLDCEFDTWAGYIGNCTAPSPGIVLQYLPTGSAT